MHGMKSVAIVTFFLMGLMVADLGYSENRPERSQRNATILHQTEIVKALIFDIGNVLVKVDLNLWQEGFKKIGVNIPADILKHEELNKLIHLYSEGKVETLSFISKFCNILNIKEIPLEKFKLAWNFVILSLYPDYINALQEFRTQGYKIYALSDNNDMHTAYIEELYQKAYPKKKFFDLFDKSYLSQRTGHRKTSDKAWLQILKEQNLKPTECLFVDDMLINIERAKRLGIKVFYFTPEKSMSDVLETMTSLSKGLS